MGLVPRTKDEVAATTCSQPAVAEQSTNKIGEAAIVRPTNIYLIGEMSCIFITTIDCLPDPHQKRVFLPPPGDAVPLLRRREDHVRGRQVPQGHRPFRGTRGGVAGQFSQPDPEGCELGRPVVQGLLTKRLIKGGVLLSVDIVSSPADA